MEDYLLFNGKRLRLGYTTGSCAAAAAKGALLYLLQGYPPQEVVIDTPAGKRLTLIIAESRRDEQGAIAAVQKDGGDDPDATHGMLIFAHLDLRDDGRIIIDGGLGVGRVTKDGLACAIGQAAINPVPRRMIEQELRSILPAGMGADVIISVPGGEEIAKRTFNPRLGIMGGISILGTSGIVKPMSEEALKESLALELKQYRLQDYRSGIFAFGNYGRDYLKLQKIDSKNIITTSNFIGYMLDQAVDMGFHSLILSGHIGKMVKVAAGIMQTHSRNADGRMETLTALAALEGADREVLEAIYASLTTSAACKIIDQHHLSGVYRRIGQKAREKSLLHCYNQLEIGILLFGDGGKLLYQDQIASKILKELSRSPKEEDDG